MDLDEIDDVPAVHAVEPVADGAGDDERKGRLRPRRGTPEAPPRPDGGRRADEGENVEQLRLSREGEVAKKAEGGVAVLGVVEIEDAGEEREGARRSSVAWATALVA